MKSIYLGFGKKAFVSNRAQLTTQYAKFTVAWKLKEIPA